MTPEQIKARHLISRFSNEVMDPYSEPKSFDEDKQCAIIAVDEIYRDLQVVIRSTGNSHQLRLIKYMIKYYKKVKEELEKIDLMDL